jgi:hypothetical protein
MDSLARRRLRRGARQRRAPIFVGKGGEVLLETDDVVITLPPSAEHEADSQRLSAPSE